MAQSNILVTSGAGNRVDTFQTATQANFRQAIVIADPSVDANTVPVHATLGAGFNILGANGTALDVNSGVKSAGTIRVVLATDQPTLTNNQPANVAQINGVTPLMGNGVTGTGAQRVTLSSDNTAIATWGQGATGAAVPSGGIYEAGLAQTALPTAATAGNLTGVMLDKYGRQVVLPQTIRDLVTDATVTISASTTETTILAAVASTFLDLTAVWVANTSATVVRVDFRDATAGTVRFSLGVPVTDTRGAVFSIPRPQTTVNNNWTAQSSVSVTDLRVYMQCVQNK